VLSGRVSTGAAVALAHGLAVFPIPAGQRTAPPGWQHRASRDPGQPWPAGSNVGVGCRASGVVGLDLDVKHGVDGLGTFARICDQHGEQWPDTFTVVTAHAGRHLYFAVPAGEVVISTIGVLGPGIDVRARGRVSGGYLIGPGSIVDGRPYTVDRDAPIAPLPGWLGRLLRPVGRPAAGPARDLFGSKLDDYRVVVGRRRVRREPALDGVR